MTYRLSLECAITSRSRNQDSFSQTVEYSQAVPTLVGVWAALHGRLRRWARRRRTGETASSSRPSATLRSTTCACALPSRHCVSTRRWEPSRRWYTVGTGGLFSRRREHGRADCGNDARIHAGLQHALSAAGESLAAVGRRVHYAYDAGTGVGDGGEVDCSTAIDPTVWTTSGDNRVLLWNVKTGDCLSSVTVCEECAEPEEVVLNAVPVRVGVGCRWHVGSERRVGYGAGEQAVQGVQARHLVLPASSLHYGGVALWG